MAFLRSLFSKKEHMTSEMELELVHAFDSSKYLQFAVHVKDITWVQIDADMWAGRFGYYVLVASKNSDGGWNVAVASFADA